MNIENTKKRRFNIVDFMLILLILGVAAGIAYIASGGLGGTSEARIEYRITVEMVRNELLEDIRRLEGGGYTVIDSVRGNYLGEVYGIEITQAYSNVTNRNTGMIERKQFPDHSRVTLIVRATADIDSDGKRYIRGTRITVGSEMHFRTTWFVSRGFCTSLKVIEPGQAETGITEGGDSQ